MIQRTLLMVVAAACLATPGLFSDSTIDGQGNVLTLGTSSVLTVSAGSTVTLKNLTLQNLSGTRLVMESSTSALVFDNCTINLDAPYSFTQGTLTIKNDVVVTGTVPFIYANNATCTIASQSMLKFELGTSFSYAPTSNSRDLVVMTDRTSKLYFNGSTLASTTTGIRLKAGTLIFDNKVTLSSSGIAVSEAIALGDVPNNIDLYIEMLAAAEVDTYGLIDIK